MKKGERNTGILMTPQQREKHILSFIPLVRHLVGRIAINIPTFLDTEDLVESGVIGLITAIDTYQPSMGTCLKTFVYTKVRGAILDELRKVSFVSRGVHQKLKRLQEAYRALENENERPPSLYELGERLTMSQEEISELLTAYRCKVFFSIDKNVGNGNGDKEAGLLSLLSSPSYDSPENIVEKKELEERLANAIEQLPTREKQLIVLYYYKNLLLKEISEILGISAARVSHLHSRALYQLNQMLTIKELA